MTSSTSITTFTRGDVVVVWWPLNGTTNVKKRPAVVVQSDALTSDEHYVAFVPLTSLKRPRQLLGCRFVVRRGTPEYQQMGLWKETLVQPDRVSTMLASDVVGVLGTCPPAIIAQLDNGLKYVLDL